MPGKVSGYLSRLEYHESLQMIILTKLHPELPGMDLESSVMQHGENILDIPDGVSYIIPQTGSSYP